MKNFALCALLMGLGLFAVGCEKKPEAPKTEPAAAAPADGAAAPAAEAPAAEAPAEAK